MTTLLQRQHLHGKVSLLWEKHIGWTLFSLSILLSLTLIFTPAARAQGTTVLRCRLDPEAVLPGETTRLVIEVVDVRNLYGYQLKLNYSAEITEAMDEDPGREGVNLTLGDFLSPDFIVLNQADNVHGVISLALVQINPTPPKSGSGELASIHFKTKTSGRADFVFNEVILSNSTAKAIPHNLEGCALQVLDLSSLNSTHTTEAAAPSPLLETQPASPLEGNAQAFTPTTALVQPSSLLETASEEESNEHPLPVGGVKIAWVVPVLVIGLLALVSIWLAKKRAG